VDRHHTLELRRHAVLFGLTMANRFGGATGMATAGFDITVVGMRPQVHTELGMQVPVREMSDAPAPDWVVLPALNRMTGDALAPALGRNDVVDALDALRAWRNGGARVAAACTGTFVLAESGLLDGGEATTTWWFSPVFRQRYPKVHLDAHRIVVTRGDALTAGAALSHLDLALWLIRNNSPELSLRRSWRSTSYSIRGCRSLRMRSPITLPIRTRSSSVSTVGCVNTSTRQSRSMSSPMHWRPPRER
jgi:transcriptional regulator GlxA family with amidase domain